MTKHITILEASDILEKYLGRLFEKYCPKNKDRELVLEGPNIVFKTDTIEFKIFGMRFKPGKKHNNYKNLIGMINVMIVFDRYKLLDKKSFKQIAEEKLEKGIKVAEMLLKGGVLFKKESSEPLIII